jgi:predicted membrane channel-forming protein YqfA (hemolysin III family)
MPPVSGALSARRVTKMFENLEADLSSLYIVLTFLCAFLALYVMQASWHESVTHSDPEWLQSVKRISHVMLIWGLMWSLAWATKYNYLPTPPDLLVLGALTVMFAARAVLLYRHRNDNAAKKFEHRIHRLHIND